MDKSYAQQVAETIRKQIEIGVFGALGAHELAYLRGTPDPGLTMKVRVLPFRADGTRSTRPRIMRMDVVLNPLDTYDIRVYYVTGLKEVEHVRYDDVYAENLNRVLLSIDSDNDREPAL